MTRSMSGRFRLVALLVSLVVIVAALVVVVNLRKDDNDKSASGEVQDGGTLVVGAEQEPDCADWINLCSGAAWGIWTMQAQTMPRAFDVVKDDGTWVNKPSILLDGEPELVTEPKQVVTYNISEDAVWSDGEPITSADFKYTAEQIRDGQDIYDATGYSQIESVETPDDKTAVVTFSEPYPGWRQLFGAGYGVFPAHLLEGKDRNAEMANGYDWSGGPWKIDKWEKGVEVVLVPNEEFWGDVPKLDKVIFRFLTETAAEFDSFEAEQVLAIYPQPQLDVVERADGLGDAFDSLFSTETGNTEALYINNEAFPFDSENVRRALGYAIDRDKIVKTLFGGVGVDEAWNTVDPPIMEEFSDPEAWAEYTLDLDMVDQLMTEDGWAKNADGIWEKDGQTASFEIKSTAGNQRRERTEEILQEQVREAGFDMTINNQEAGDLFGEQLPAGDFQVGLYAQILTALDPSNCTLYCSENIPGPANDNSGQNWTRTNVPEVDPLLKTVDTSLDDDERKAANQEAVRLLAATNTVLPLDPLPNIVLWNKRIVGDVGDNPVYSMFVNMNEWQLRK